tara:strand:+ start:5824 stop:6531 length:708 start_codon:yes stop_codon:yes gene_type:complete
MNSPTLLIDADIVCYQVASVVEHVIEWADDTFTLHATMEDATSQLQLMVDDLREQANTDDLIFAFSDKGNWRKALWSGYKAHRKSVRKPIIYKALRKYVEEKHTSRTEVNCEADDVLGILQTQLDNTIIWSPDKDLKQIPGKHLVDDEIITITEEQGDNFHMFQTLCGDPTDGYKGCPGIGPKKAEGVTEWADVLALFEKAGLTEQDALLQARLSKILRCSDYLGKGQVALWTPK